MPYIVITNDQCDNNDANYPQRESRRAVATLEEARESVHALVIERDPGFSARAEPLTVPGTIGPLPDGTTIEIARVEIAALAAMVPRLLDDGENVVDAYNAR